MKKNILNKIAALACILIIAAGCKSKKLVVVNRPVKDSVTAVKVNDVATRLVAIRAKQVTFNTFNGKAKTKLSINNDENDVTLNVRIARDQKIWLSITTFLGIEAARAVITPDSLIVLNRLQGLYIREPFSFIHQFTGKQVNFKTVQSLLVGNAIGDLLNEGAEFTPQGTNTLVSGNLQDIVYKLLLGADLKVTQTTLNNQLARQSLQVTNGVFIQANNRIVPSQIDINSTAGNKKIQANLRYTKVEFDLPLEYPFSVPKSYERTK